MSKKAELIGSHFPTIYLTVISLLQGLALSLLVPNIISYFEKAGDQWMDLRLLPFIVMLLVVFIVWHHYAIGIFFLRWFPNIIDTAIPFMVSIGQFFLIALLDIDNSIDDMDVDAWTLGFALLMLAGSLAYFAVKWRIDPTLFTNIMSLEDAEEHCRLTRRYYVWSGLAVLFQGLFVIMIILFDDQRLLFFSVLFLIGHIGLSEYFKLVKIKPHFIESLDEKSVEL